MYILESCTSDSLQTYKSQGNYFSAEQAWGNRNGNAWKKILAKVETNLWRKMHFLAKLMWMSSDLIGGSGWQTRVRNTPTCLRRSYGKVFPSVKPTFLTIVHQECSTGRWITILPAMCLCPTAGWCQGKATMVKKKKDRETSSVRKAKASLCLLPIVGDPVADITTWTSVQLMESFFYIEINRYPPNHMSTMPCLICDSVWHAMF